MLTATLCFEDCSKSNITCLETILNGPKNSLVQEMPIFSSNFPEMSAKLLAMRSNALPSSPREDDACLLQHRALENCILSISMIFGVS